MEYYLSPERTAKKERMEQQVEEKKREWERVVLQQIDIGDIRDISWRIKQKEIQIRKMEIEREVRVISGQIDMLYAGEIYQNLKDRRQSTGMQTEEFLHDKYMAEFYRDIIRDTWEMADIMLELDIWTMKLNLSSLEKASRRVSKEQADMYMAEIQGKLVEISEDLQEAIDSIAEKYKSYKRKVVQLPIACGRKISDKQKRTINDQVTQLDKTEGTIPTDNEIDNIASELARKYLVQQNISELSQTASNETEIRMKIKSFSYHKSESDENFKVYPIQIRYDNGKTKIFRVKVNKESIPITDNKESRKLLVELLRDKGLINFDSSNEEVELGTLIMKNGKLIVKEELEEAR